MFKKVSGLPKRDKRKSKANKQFLIQSISYCMNLLLYQNNVKNLFISQTYFCMLNHIKYDVVLTRLNVYIRSKC